MAAPADPSSLSRSDLEAEVAALRGEVAELKQLIMALREENARLKGLKARPVIKPSGMEEATTPKRRGRPGRRRGKVVPRVPVETQVLGWRCRLARNSRATSRIRCRSWRSARGRCATAVSAG